MSGQGLKPLYEKSHDGPMRVGGLMSGKGSNLREIIKCGPSSGYEVRVIFSDNAESNATRIGRDYDIPVITRDIIGFYKARGKPKRDLIVREGLDRETVRLLKGFGVDVLAYAGYMSLATPVLIDSFLGVNVHPADSILVDGRGTIKYKGAHAVRDAIVAGESKIRAVTHIVEPKVDNGRILMRSAPHTLSLRAELMLLSGKDPLHNPENKELIDIVSDENQDKLKEVGDLKIFPLTLAMLANNSIMQDGEGRLYFGAMAIPNGIDYEDLMRADT